MDVVKGHVITPEDKANFVQYIANNLKVQVSEKSGKQFLTVPGWRAEFGGLEGQFRCSFYGITEVEENAVRNLERAKATVSKLTPEARQALLEELANE